MRSVKHILLILVLWVAIPTGIAAQPTLDVAQKEHDFGKIAERGGVVKHEFKFKNNGDKPLVIISAETNCKCTKITYPRQPITPGGESAIVITYDPKRQEGTFHKAIIIQSNIPEKRTILVINGAVEK